MFTKYIDSRIHERSYTRALLSVIFCVLTHPTVDLLLYPAFSKHVTRPWYSCFILLVLLPVFLSANSGQDIYAGVLSRSTYTTADTVLLHLLVQSKDYDAFNYCVIVVGKGHHPQCGTVLLNSVPFTADFYHGPEYRIPCDNP